MPTRKQRSLPVVGSTYSKTYKGSEYVMTVVRSDNQLAYSVGGEIFQTPTAAAKHITNADINGWKFWKMD